MKKRDPEVPKLSEGDRLQARLGLSPATFARALLVLLAASIALLALPAARAAASPTQVAMFQDDARMLTQPAQTLADLRLIGVDQVRLAVRWMNIAPRPTSHRRPRGFSAANPADYPKRNWAPWDAIVRDAKQAGITVNFNVVGGAPLWATGPGAPTSKAFPNWEPSAREFGSFMRALAMRYSGTYDPRRGSSSPGNRNDLPRVSFWSIWNEPDYGPSLSPQGVPGHATVENSPRMYRNLVNAAWSALHATGHGADTILIGELAPRGESYWGLFSGMKPLAFVRALYCVDSRYRQLRGSAAAMRGCPATAAGSAHFRARNPGLFNAAGFADHPYSRWYPPNVEAQPDPDFSSLAELPGFERGLDRVMRAYGSARHLPVWNTEYGYLTSPPKHSTRRIPDVSQATAAYYLNWAEYISWRSSRVQSTMQYLYADPLPALKSNQYGGFASGLVSFSGRPKPTYDAYRLPLYLPRTTGSPHQRLEVWGAVRPAHFALLDVPADSQTAEIQFRPQAGGAWTTLDTVAITDPHGYFDVHVKFPGNGAVRLAWTYPGDDPLLAPNQLAHSRPVQIVIHQ